MIPPAAVAFFCRRSDTVEMALHPAPIIADLLASALTPFDYRREDAERALKGDIDKLLGWERDAIEFLRQNWLAATDQPPILINAWTATVVKAYAARGGPTATQRTT
jgi:hypothetical protein